MATIKSIEEKAKRYDEAINTIRNLVKAGLIYEDAAIQVFPELKESEDERIRKALIEGFNKLDKSAIWYNGITNGQILSWLEKQGRLMKALQISNSRIAELVEEKYNLEEKLEKQGEQKSAELPKGEDYGIDGLYAAIDILQKTLGEVDGYQSDDGILSHKCAISAVKELSKQKPAWSEEDINMFGSILSTLGICANNPQIPADVRSIHKKEESWFNELYHRVLPEQEWSEEDEDKLKSIEFYLDDDNAPSELYYWLEDRLKSLKERFTWKPSDEQINALANALSLAKNCGEEWAFDLRTLHEQLKKLKE